MERELSDLKMERRECGKCGATWINGQHMWATGKVGNEADLAGLVCDKLGNDECINPCRGTKHSGDTWEKRFGDIEAGFESKRLRMEEQRRDFRDKYGEDPHFDD